GLTNAGNGAQERCWLLTEPRPDGTMAPDSERRAAAGRRLEVSSVLRTLLAVGFLFGALAARVPEASAQTSTPTRTPTGTSAARTPSPTASGTPSPTSTSGTPAPTSTSGTPAPTSTSGTPGPTSTSGTPGPALAAGTSSPAATGQASVSGDNFDNSSED